MATNKPIVVIINTDRLRYELEHHRSPVYSTDTSFGLSFEDILQLLSALAPHSDDVDAVSEMSYDIAESMEFADGNDYNALVALLNDTIRFINKNLGEVARAYPKRQAYFSELKGNSAFFLLE